MTRNNLILIGIGLFIGIIIQFQFSGFGQLQADTSRDTILSNLEQVNILATSNNELTVEINTLEDNLDNLTEQSQSLDQLQNDITQYEKISGVADASGPGISVTYTIPVESYWVIDLINELNLAGAEAIAINDIRFTNYTYILTDYNPDPVIVINGSQTLEVPITVTAIGNTETLKQYIEQSTGTLKKLSSAFPDFSNLYYVTTHEITTLKGESHQLQL